MRHPTGCTARCAVFPRTGAVGARHFRVAASKEFQCFARSPLRGPQVFKNRWADTFERYAARRSRRWHLNRSDDSPTPEPSKHNDLESLERPQTMNDTTLMTKDPICGMTVDPKTALHAERDGKQVYFCSEHCRQKFLAAPAGTKPEGKSGGCCG